MQDTAGRILGIARQLVIDEGAAAVSMRRVAAAAGLTPMAIYRHYDNREALLQRVADDCFDEIGQRWASRRRATDPDARAAELLDDHLDFALGQPRLYDFIFTDLRAGARRWPEDFAGAASPSLSLVTDLLRDTRTGDDAEELSLAFAALMHGLVRLYRGGRIALSEEDFRALCHRLVRRMLHGLHD